MLNYSKGGIRHGIQWKANAIYSMALVNPFGAKKISFLSGATWYLVNRYPFVSNRYQPEVCSDQKFLKLYSKYAILNTQGKAREAAYLQQWVVLTSYEVSRHYGGSGGYFLPLKTVWHSPTRVQMNIPI